MMEFKATGRLINEQKCSCFINPVDYAIHWINLHPVDRTSGFSYTYPLDSDLFNK